VPTRPATGLRRSGARSGLGRQGVAIARQSSSITGTGKPISSIRALTHRLAGAHVTGPTPKANQCPMVGATAACRRPERPFRPSRRDVHRGVERSGRIPDREPGFDRFPGRKGNRETVAQASRDVGPDHARGPRSEVAKPATVSPAPKAPEAPFGCAGRGRRLSPCRQEARRRSCFPYSPPTPRSARSFHYCRVGVAKPRRQRRENTRMSTPGTAPEP
jgi:hypothetical protein